MRTFLTVGMVLFSLAFLAQAQPDIDPSDTHHDFGPVGLGLEALWDVVLANAGIGALTISSVTPTLPEFHISQPTFPKTLTPGESLAVTVVFQPAALGHLSGFIEIISNDPDEGLLIIEVEGEGMNVAHISAPDTVVPAGAHIFLPIRLSDVTGLGITSMVMRLVFDETIVLATGASLVGTLAESWGLSVSSGINQIHMELNGPAPLTGSGPVVLIDMSALEEALPGESTPLIVTDVTFNDGLPLAAPHDGLLTIANYSITGEVLYYRGAVPVPDVQLTLEGGAEQTTWTGAAGTYGFIGIPGGRDYTVTPSKQGDVFRAINSYDAALVMRYSIDLVQLNPLQIIAADVSGDGTVGGLDASYILRFRVGIIDRFPIGEEWLFLPEGMDYDSLSADQTNQDYTVVAYGDVSGNWTPAGARKELLSRSGIRLDPALLISAPGARTVLSVPVVIEGAEGFQAADLELGYDATRIHPLAVEKSPATADFLLCFHAYDNRLRIALAGTEALWKDVILCHILFEIAPGQDLEDGLPLEISASLDDGQVIADDQQVSFSIAGPVLPRTYGLEQNYPNPFNPTTTISYTLPVQSGEFRVESGENALNSEPLTLHVTLKIYNILGQEVKTLVNAPQADGDYTVSWDGRDADGREASSGIYIYRLDAGLFTATKQMMLIR